MDRSRLLQLAQDCEAEAERVAKARDETVEAAEKAISGLLEQAAKFREMAKSAVSTPLHIGATDSTDSAMNVNARNESVRRAVGRATREHRAQKALYKAGKTITDIARELGEGRPRVSSWFADGEANRPIPRRYADALARKYDVPIGAWARIKD